MKALNFIVTIVALLGLLSCSNRPISPAPDAAEVVESDPSSQSTDDYFGFIGKADGLRLEVQIIDPYLAQVINGNHYDNSGSSPSGPLQSVYTVKVQVKITDFNYFGNPVPVDIICEKDYIDNKLELLLIGTGPDGEGGQFFTDGANDLFYFGEVPPTPWSDPVVQGPEHEINFAMVDSDSTFFCKGYVNGTYENNYEVAFYKKFEESNLDVETIFSMEDRTLEGVISIRKRNGYDEYVNFFLSAP